MPLPLILALATALPAPLPIDQIVRRTTEVAARDATGLRCRVQMTARQLDSDGKVETEQQSEYEETRLPGGKVDRHVLRASTDGRDTTGEARDREAKRRADEKRWAAEGRKPPNPDKELSDLSPFAPGRADDHEFALARTDTLWGRPVYVLTVKARGKKPKETAGNGTAWIDAERFVPLKGEYTPASLPRKVTWMKIQTQHTLHPSGVAIPTLLKMDGSGEAFFVRKGFTSTFRWGECRRE